MPKFDAMCHRFVSNHILLSEEEGQKILKQFKLDKVQLPRIFITDPCAKAVKAKVGDIIRVERESPTAVISYAYRVVVEPL